MKAYTDIEQSKRLAEILPIESADNHYVRKVQDSMGEPVDGKWSTPKYGNPNSSHANYFEMVVWLKEIGKIRKEDILFDYRGLIPGGLANEAPEGMYEHETKLEFQTAHPEVDSDAVNESGSRIEVGCKIRSKTNPDVILSIISDDCHGDKFECSNGSVLSLRQINKCYDLYIEENKGTIIIN